MTNAPIVTRPIASSSSDRVAKCGEYRVIAKADIADNHLASVNSDPKLDRLLQFAGELMIHVFNIGGDHGGRPHRLTADWLSRMLSPWARAASGNTAVGRGRTHRDRKS